MKSVNQFAASLPGFAVLLAAGIGLLLLAVGFGPNTLPYPPTQVSPGPTTGASTVPLGWPFSDAMLSHWPNALFFQRSVRAGAWPLWRPLIMSGQPFAANPLNKVWYPPQWLVIVLPVTLHLNLMIWAHLVLAGVGMRSLGRRLGLGVGAASVIGVAYALTPRLAAATGAGHLDIVYATAWFPWVLWAIHRAITGYGGVGQRGAVLGVICALCFLADIRLSLFVFATGAALVLWFGWRADAVRRRSALAAITLGAALAVGLTAVQWLPLVDLAPYLSRNGMTIEDAGVFSLPPRELLTMLLPNRGGLHETMAYVGIPVLILALVGFSKSPRRLAIWAIVAVCGAFYAFGGESFVWPLLVKLAPPLLWFRVPSRAWIIVVVALVILAGFGLEALVSRRVSSRWLSPVGIGLIGIGAAFGLMARLLPLRPGAGIAAAGGLLATGILLFVQDRLRPAPLTALACGLIVIDLVWMDVSLVAGLPQSMWLDTYTPVAQTLRDEGVTRLYSPDASLLQQVTTYWNIPDLGGIDPFQLRSYVSAFESATGIRATGYSVTLPAFSTDDPDFRTANRNVPVDAEKLSQWNVSHVLSSFPIDSADLRLARRVEDLYLYENTRRPQGVTVTWDGPNRFTASNSGDRTVNVEAWAPGWEPTEQGDQTALAVAPGETITREYNPPGLVPGLALSAISLGFCLFAAVIVGNRPGNREQSTHQSA